MKKILSLLFYIALFTNISFAKEIYEHTKEDKAKNCKVCHDVSQGKKYIHRPILAGSCTLCHNLSSKKENLLRNKPIESCILCHSDKRRLVKQIKKNVHPPVLQDCTLCHDPHSGDLQFRLKADKKRDLCLTCHKDKKRWIKNVKNKHGAINLKDGGCIFCHDPHFTGRKKMLKADTTKQLCLSCHDKKLKRDEDGRVIKNMKRFFDKSKVIHSPIKKGDCVGCHNPHGSNNYRMLKESSTAKLCVSCHKDKRKFIYKKTKNVHPPVKKNCAACHDPHAGKNKNRLKADKRKALCLTCHKEKKEWIKNVKNKHGAIDLKNGGCIACHDPHYTGKKKMLKGKTTRDLCLSCHYKTLKRDEDGKMLLNMKKHLKDNKQWHGPIIKGDCVGCHNPHGSNNYRMLKGPYPTKSIAKFKPESYLCFNCHPSNKITERKTTSATNFRKNEKNLHTVHVKNYSITCRTCHDVHASKKPKPLIKDKTNFSNTEFKLRYIKTPNGGSCNPVCHNKREYNRGFSSTIK